MEDTQVLNWEVEVEEETDRPSDSACSLEPLGRLHIFSSAYGPEKDFPLYLGKNVVGRMPDCSVALPFPSISKQHAVIEILAWNKAPILRDCGSLNGTQILRPPKFLSPGMSHPLRDQELVVFADLPCQYHRLDASLPFVSRGPLTVEQTPKVQQGTKPWGILLAEDSEDEVDHPSERCIVKGQRTMSSPLATVVPESDEEGPSSAPDGLGPPSAFNFNRDTNEEESHQPAAGETSAATRNAIAEIEQPKAVLVEIQFGKDQYSLQERNSETRVGRYASNGVLPERSQPAEEDSETDVDDESEPPATPAEVHLERAQPSGFIDSDTDVEDERVLSTPALAPKKRQIFHGVSTERPGGSDLAHLQELQENLAGSDTDVEEAEAPLTISSEQSQASMVIDSSTDDEEEVSAALTLAHLRETRATMWNRDTDQEQDRAQSLALDQSQTSAGKDSDTDEERAFPVEKREYVSRGHTHRAHSEKNKHPFGDNDTEVVEGKSSPGVHIERGQASTTVGINTQVEEEVPPGPAVILLEKHRVRLAWTNQTTVEAEGDPAKLPVVHPEEAQPSPDTGTAGGPTQPQRKGAQFPRESRRELHVDMTKDSAHSHDDSEDLDLQATQCFVERENQRLEGVLDEPWEVLATQPFCSRESEAFETQPIAAHLEGRGLWSFSPRGTHQDQHPENPVHEEPLGIQSRGIQTAEKAMGIPGESAERVTSEREPLDKDTKTLPTEGLRDMMGEEELAMVMKDRKQNQMLARDTQRQESDKMMKSTNMKRDMESLKVEIETPKELQKVVKQTLPREVFEREAERLAPERECKPSGLEVSIPKVILEGGTWGQWTERGSRDQKGLASSPTLDPEGRARNLPELASAVISSESQSGGGRGAPVSPRRQHRGHLNYKMPSSEKASRGDPETLDACLPLTVPEASAAVQNSLISQSQKQPALQPLFAPSQPSLEPPIPKQNENQEAPESPLSSELDPLHAKPNVRPWGCSRMTPSPVSSVALEPHPTTHTDQPVTPESTSRATWGGSSVKTPEPMVPIAPELQPSTSTSHPVTPQPTSRATRGRAHRSSVKIHQPVVATVPELQPSTSTNQPVTPEPTSRATRGRAHRSSVRTPEPIVPTASELQPSTDQPVTPEPTSRATRGRARRSSVKIHQPVVATVPELQPATSTDQPVTPEPTSRATRGRAHRSSVRTPEPTVPTASELQPSTSTDQPVTPEPTSRATRGRAHRSSVKTPEPTVPTASELQPSTSTDQPATLEPTSRATRGRARRSSVKTPESIVPTASELQPSTNQPVTPESTSRATWGGSSVKTPEPVVPIAPELQPSTSTGHPVSPEPTSRATRGRAHRSSVKIHQSVVATVPELQPATSTDEPVTPEPTSRATRGRARRSSVRTHQPTEPTASDLEPPSPTDQLVIPKAVTQGGQNRTLRSTRSAMPVSTTPEFQSPVPTDQPIPLESIPQANCSRRPRATRKHGSLAAPIIHEPCSAPLEPNSRSSRNQRQGAVRAAESVRTIAEPAFPQLPEAPTHASQIQKVEAAGKCEFIQESQPKAFQNRKRLSGTVDSPPRQKRLQRGEIPQKTVFIKEEEVSSEKSRKEEDIVIPGPGKRKRDQSEEEPKGMPVRSLRRTKPNQESTAPKVLFTGVVDACGEQAVLALGGSLASSVAEATHLVTDRICRTVKFLCALGRGIPILSLNWLHQSHKTGCFLPPDEYVVTDPEQEKNFGFSLRESLSRARDRRLLEGYEIHVTPGVQPPPPQMREIISCCGGTVLPNMPRSYKPQRVVITCSQDLPRCTAPLRVGLPILSPEFLLTGVLKQEAKPEAFVLSPSEMSST